jgi:Flp pilus assembly protein protease CpaA
MSNTGFQFGLICLIFASVLIVVVVLLFLRYRRQQMAHQERLAALEKGATIPPGAAPAPWSPRVYLLRGLIWSFTGAALTIALLGASLSDRRHYRESAEWMAMRARNVSQNLQIPIEQARQIVEKDEAARASQDTGMPPAIALFGLIPLGVGLAYIVFYRSGESQQAVSSRA